MTDKIEAHIRMEERYEGLQLRFGDNVELKKEALEAVDYAKQQTGMSPLVFDNIDKSNPQKEAIYIEFNDDSQRDAGAFFEIVLHRLGIKCEKDL